MRTCSATACTFSSLIGLPRRGDDADILDLGVQDTGPAGARWALAFAARPPTAALLTAWTLRGAPHVYRRAHVAEVAVAISPLLGSRRSQARLRPPPRRSRPPASRSWRPSTRSPTEMRALVTRRPSRATCPTARHSEAARALPSLLPRRRPRPPLRAAVPVWRSAGRPGASARHVTTGPPADPAAGGARPREVAPPLEPDPRRPAPSRSGDPKRSPPTSTGRSRTSPRTGPPTPGGPVEGEVRSPRRRRRRHGRSPPDAGLVRLLGPFDPFLQARDRELSCPTRAPQGPLAHAGRPGAVLAGHEIRGTWRPRVAGEAPPGGRRLGATAGSDRAGRALAAFRGVAFAGFVEA